MKRRNLATINRTHSAYFVSFQVKSTAFFLINLRVNVIVNNDNINIINKASFLFLIITLIFFLTQETLLRQNKKYAAHLLFLLE